MIHWTLEWLRDGGIEFVILNPLIRHFADVASCVGTGSAFDLNICYMPEEEPIGSLRTLDRVANAFGTPLLVVYGDTLFEMPLSIFTSYATSLDGDTSLILVNTHHDPRSAGIVQLNARNYVTKFSEKPSMPDTSLAFSGLLLAQHTYGFRTDIASDLLPRLRRGTCLKAYRTDHRVLDIGTPETYQRAQSWPL